MLFTKPIEEITFQDIVDFCNEQIGENINLDYKQEIDTGLAKTVAAMANTWGGLIIIGAEDEDSKPKLPPKGVEFKQHLREQLNNIILGNITPPVFPEVQICQSEDSHKALILVRVPQSNHTPHAIRGNTKVYIRTDTSNEPEELATVDRITWLLDKRQKSEDLKNSFFEKPTLRLIKLTNKTTPIDSGDLILSSTPLYPFEVLIDYKKLRSDILQEIKVDEYYQHFPSNVNYAQFEPTQNGSYSLFYNESRQHVSYEELNHYGFFYHREQRSVSSTEDDGTVTTRIYPIHILVDLYLFLKSMTKFYSSLGYWGFIEIKFDLDKIGAIPFTDLPAPRGKYKISSETKTPVDNKISFTRMVMVKDLEEKHREIINDLFIQFMWAVGFSWITEESLDELFEKGW